MLASLNVLGTPLLPCSHDPVTGWFRDGCCNTDNNDRGSHTVCCMVTDAFLAFLSEELGNDLVTPMAGHGFPGLRAGDQWCVCAASWLVAFEADQACPVSLQSTHAKALEVVALEKLMMHAIAPEA
jgi:uncharacterized protein